MRGLSILPVVFLAGSLLAFSGCRGCSCSREARDSGIDAGSNAVPVRPDAGVVRREQPAQNKPGTIREGAIEMKPGAVLSTSGRGSTGAGEAPSVGNPNVPPSSVRAISALKDFQLAHPKLVVKNRENAEKRPPHSDVGKERSTEGLRKVPGASPEKAPGK